MTPLARLVTGFFRQYLAMEKGISKRTMTSYSYAFKFLCRYVSGRLGKSPSRLSLEDLDTPMIRDFLEHLERDRGNTMVSAGSQASSVNVGCPACSSSRRGSSSSRGLTCGASTSDATNGSPRVKMMNTKIQHTKTKKPHQPHPLASPDAGDRPRGLLAPSC